MRKNLDVDLYDTREDALQAVLDGADPGDCITICRGDWEVCSTGAVCPMCARVKIREDMSVEDVIGASQAYHA